MKKYFNHFISAILFSALAVLFIFPAPSRAEKPGAIIESITAEELPEPFESHGDLWFSTLAEDGTLFVSWGDGFGPKYGESDAFSHHGLAKISGTLPEIDIEVVKRFMPLSDDANNSKPTSLLSIGGRLYVAVHSPLLVPTLGFIAYSDDNGETFHYDLDTTRTTDKNTNFICLMFINMGKNYELNTDGYIYAFGVPGEINTTGKVYLTRMTPDGILDESTWTYYAGLDENKQPEWSQNYKDAKRIKNLAGKNYSSLFPDLLFSAAYHPGTGRYLVLTATTTEGSLYEAPNPWGPWRFVSRWFEGAGSPWASAYMPGIISKDMGPDSFYFAVGGRFDFDPPKGDRYYRFRLGRITMKLRERPEK